MMEVRLQSAEQQSNDKCTKYNHARKVLFVIFVRLTIVFLLRASAMSKSKLSLLLSTWRRFVFVKTKKGDAL
jgi:hypothetical protein